MEQDEEGVITFAQIWRVVKKSIPRAVIYVAVCVIVCFAVLYSAKTFACENTYSAAITFKQSDENIKTTLDGYRATATSNAVDEVFGSSDDATKIYEAVLDTLTITAYIPEAYTSDTSYIAATYNVSFNQLDIDGVSGSQQISLLDNICTELVDYYAEVSSTAALSSDLAWGYSADYSTEYLDILDELSTRLSTAKNVMTANISANSEINSRFTSYKSTSEYSSKRTANEILTLFDNLQYRVSALEETVLANGITNTAATLHGADYCKIKTDAYQIEIDALETLASAYQDQITDLAEIIQKAVDNAANNVGSSGSTMISVDISSYTALVEQYLEGQTTITSLQQKIAEVGQYSDYIESNQNNNSANMAAIEYEIDCVIDDVAALIAEYNDLVSAFEENVMPSSYASVSKPAAAYSDSIISTSILLVTVVAVAAVAYIAAFGQTWTAMKKAGTLDADDACGKDVN